MQRDLSKKFSQKLSHSISLSNNSGSNALISHFIVVYLVAKPLIWSEAEGDLVVIETSI